MERDQTSNILTYAKNKIAYQQVRNLEKIERKIQAKTDLLKQNELWSNIRKAAKSNPGLQNILD